MTKIALTIGSSDSWAKEETQVDLSTFAMHRFYGTNALTCITAQNTFGLNHIIVLSIAMVKAQIQAIASDLRVDAFKAEMLLNHQIVKTVAWQFKKLGKPNLPNLVVDSVMFFPTERQLFDW